MANQDKHASGELVGQAASILAGVELPASDRDATATVVTSLLADMAAMRRMNLGENEPATVYNPSAT